MHAHAITTEGSRYHMHHRVPSAHFTQIWIWILKWIAMRKRGRNSLRVCWSHFQSCRALWLMAPWTTSRTASKNGLFSSRLYYSRYLHAMGAADRWPVLLSCRPMTGFVQHLQGIPHVSERRGQRYLEEFVTFLIYTNSSRTNSWNEWNGRDSCPF